MPRFIGYDQAERMLAALLPRAEGFAAEAVAAIVRGGLVPGTMVASTLALPLAMLRLERATGAVDWVGPPALARRILLVDDGCSTGHTMATVRAHLVGLGHDVATMAIVHDPDVTRYTPDFSHPMRELFRFPWERGEATPEARAARIPGQPSNLATERPFIGLDLDGVFLPDIPSAHYDADLADALRRRRALAPFPALPRFDPARAVVITGRPEMDRADTAAWLAQHGHGDLRLECRPEDVGTALAEVARYKAETATRWGCTHFVESDPEQSIRIAAHAPHLLVSWWSAEETRAWMVGAAAG